MCFEHHQVKFMKRIAEMSDLSQVIRTLPRIKKHLLNPDNMRWVHLPPADPSVYLSRIGALNACLFSNCSQWTRFFCHLCRWKLSSLQIKASVPCRCAVNTSPQKMSDAAAQLESFMKEVAENRKERKPVRTHIIEVSCQPTNWANEEFWLVFAFFDIFLFLH